MKPKSVVYLECDFLKLLNGESEFEDTSDKLPHAGPAKTARSETPGLDRLRCAEALHR